MRQPAAPPHIGLLLRGTRSPGYPEPGFFVVRLARGGPLVPGVIYRPCPMVLPEDLPDNPEYWCLPTETTPLPVFQEERTPTLWQGLRASIGDDELDPCELWVHGRTDPVVVDRQLSAVAAYQWRMEVREWAVRHAPQHPEANPRQRVDIARLPSLL